MDRAGYIVLLSLALLGCSTAPAAEEQGIVPFTPTATDAGESLEPTAPQSGWPTSSPPVIESLTVLPATDDCKTVTACIVASDADTDPLDVVWDLGPHSPPSLGPRLREHTVTGDGTRLSQCVQFSAQAEGKLEIRALVFERLPGPKFARVALPTASRVFFDAADCNGENAQSPTSQSPLDTPQNPEVPPESEPEPQPEQEPQPEKEPEPSALGFQIELLVVDEIDPVVKTVFEEAAARLSAVIVDDVPDVAAVTVPAGVCGTPHPELANKSFDDLTLMVHFVSIDGPGGVLAQAGPCALREESALPFLGVMIFDADDTAWSTKSGLLGDIILHEMTHALGFGTLWKRLGLLQGAESNDPYYVGAQASEAFFALSGDVYQGNIVPVENQGGPGTALGHLRESVFGAELMTGYINPNKNPLSTVSIAALADMGYAVTLQAADVYMLPATSNQGLMLGGSEEFPDTFQGPQFTFPQKPTRTR